MCFALSPAQLCVLLQLSRQEARTKTSSHRLRQLRALIMTHLIFVQLETLRYEPTFTFVLGEEVIKALCCQVMKSHD